MPDQDNKIRVVFSVTNCICYDQRVLKIAETVSTLGCEVTIVGRRMGECCDSGSVPFRTKRFRMLIRRGFFFYKFFNIRLFIYLVFHKYDLYVANDLDTLLPNFLVSKLKTKVLVYDSHEYFTGLPELNGRPIVRRIWKAVERMIFPNLKHVMTVSSMIAEQYFKEYGIKPSVVRNCSENSSDIRAFSRKELGIEENSLLLIFQGSGINIDKGGEELIDAVRMTEQVSLLIVGSGDKILSLKQRAGVLHMTDRIRFIPKVPWQELMRYTRSADAGLSLEKDTNLNYRFSLPNKLFDYISAGIPVVAGNLPEISRIITENNCGIIIPSVTPEEISKAIVTLRDDRVLLNKLKQNAVTASESLSWEKEKEKVTAFYKTFLK
ncbi:MAG: glycosyltransferase [Bacteroidales bacterium]|nr:glycosyltransferase [Bacteroidales bacterium]